MQKEERNEEILEAHAKRLRALEVRKALQGFGAPVDLDIEIEDIKKKIAELQQRQAHVGIGSNPNKQQASSIQLYSTRRRVDVIFHDVIFNGNTTDITNAVKNSLIKAIAEFTSTPPEQINLISVPGKNTVRIELPDSAAQELVRLHEAKDDNLQTAGIVAIKKGEPLKKNNPSDSYSDRENFERARRNAKSVWYPEKEFSQKNTDPERVKNEPKHIHNFKRVAQNKFEDFLFFLFFGTSIILPLTIIAFLWINLLPTLILLIFTFLILISLNSRKPDRREDTYSIVSNKNYEQKMRYIIVIAIIFEAVYLTIIYRNK